MNLQFADLNADGQQDIVTATFEGTPMVVYGGEKGWEAPQHIVDSQDRNIVLSLYYDMEENKYANVDRSPEGATHAEDHCVSATVMDWDGDGDLDLLVGAKEGRLYLRQNNGSAAKPSFSDVNELLKTGDKEFMIPGGLTAARPVDWDADGDLDLLCGSFSGGVYFVENTGAAAVVLAEPVQLFDGNVDVGADTPAKSINWYADPVDYDSDGKLDLLVGMHISKPVKAKVLTDDEKAELEKMVVRSDEVNAIFQKQYEEMEEKTKDLSDEEKRAAMDELYSSDEFTKLNEEMRDLYERREELHPSARNNPGVWLYRGK